MAYSKNKKRIYQKGGSTQGKPEKTQDLPEMTARAYDTARELVQSGKMGTNVFDNLYRRYNWAKYDPAVRKNTPEEQAELEQTWYGGYNPVDIANKVPATLLAGAAGPFAIGAATPAVSTALANPWVQAGLTAYGGYDATTNTIPSAYRALQEGKYWDAAGNIALTGLNLAPIPAFGPSALRKGISKQKNLRLDKLTKEQEEWKKLYDIVKASKTPKKNPIYKHLDNPYNPLLKDDIPSILKTSKNPSVDPFDKILNKDKPFNVTKEASPELLETMKKFLEGSKGSLDDFKYGGKKKNIQKNLYKYGGSPFNMYDKGGKKDKSPKLTRKEKQLRFRLDQYFNRFGIDNPYIRAAILGNIEAEGGTAGRGETTYRYNSGLTNKYDKHGNIKKRGVPYVRSLFPGRLAHLSDKELSKLVKDDKAFYDTIYGPRAMKWFIEKEGWDPGNHNPGDGWKYRGRGLNQLTFKAQYQAMQDKLKKLGYDYDLVNNPDLLDKDKDLQALVAVMSYKERLNKMPRGQFGYSKYSDIDNLEDASRVVAYGNAGWGDPPRSSYTNKVIQNAPKYFEMPEDYGILPDVKQLPEVQVNLQDLKNREIPGMWNMDFLTEPRVFKDGGVTDSNMDYLNPQRKPMYSTPTFAQTYKPYLGYGYQYQYGGNIHQYDPNMINQDFYGTDPYGSTWTAEPIDSLPMLDYRDLINYNEGMTPDTTELAPMTAPPLSKQDQWNQKHAGESVMGVPLDAQGWDQLKEAPDAGNYVAGAVTAGTGIADLTKKEGDVEVEEVVDVVQDTVGTIIPIAGIFDGISDTGQSLAASWAPEGKEQEHADWSRRLFEPHTMITVDWLGEEDKKKKEEEASASAYAARGVKYGGNIYQTNIHQTSPNMTTTPKSFQHYVDNIAKYKQLNKDLNLPTHFGPTHQNYDKHKEYKGYLKANRLSLDKYYPEQYKAFKQQEADDAVKRYGEWDQEYWNRKDIAEAKRTNTPYVFKSRFNNAGKVSGDPFYNVPMSGAGKVNPDHYDGGSTFYFVNAYAQNKAHRDRIDELNKQFPGEGLKRHQAEMAKLNEAEARKRYEYQQSRLPINERTPFVSSETQTFNPNEHNISTLMSNNKYGGNIFNNYAGGGNMFNNYGFGVNTMNEIPVNEFKAGGTHEENPLGGIPQGIGPNGAPNLVEEGELKIPDPRDPSGNSSFIVSAQPDMKITKAIAEKNGLSKNYVGKTVRKAADMLLRKSDLFAREGDTIKQNSINQDLIAFMNAHEELTAMKESKENAKFQEKLGNLAEEFPQQMDAMMQPPQEAMPQQGMPQEAAPQGMPQGMPMGMPPMGIPGMAKYGGRKNIHQISPNMSVGPTLDDYYSHYLPPVDRPLTEEEAAIRDYDPYNAYPIPRVMPSGLDPMVDQINFDIIPQNNTTSPIIPQQMDMYMDKKINRKQFGGNIHQFGDKMYTDPVRPYSEEERANIVAGEQIQKGLDFSTPEPPEEIDLMGDIGTEVIIKANQNKEKEIKKLKEEIVKLEEKVRNFEETGKDVDKKVETVKEIERKQSALSAMMQMAPIAMNLGMGLLGKKDKLELSRMSPTELRRIDAQERIKGLGYDLAATRERLRGAAGGQGGTYLGNMQALFNRGAEARGKIYSDVERQNIGIDAREKAMNQRADQINMSQEAREKMYEKQALAAKQNMLNTGVQQLAQYFAAQDANKLGADYAGMHSDTYKYTWKPFIG